MPKPSSFVDGLYQRSLARKATSKGMIDGMRQALLGVIDSSKIYMSILSQKHNKIIVEVIVDTSLIKIDEKDKEQGQR